MVVKETGLGRILVDAGLVDREQLKQVLDSQEDKTLIRTLVDSGLTTDKKIAEAISSELGLPLLNLTEYEVNPGAAAMLSEEITRKYLVVPVDFKENKLILAVADPTNVLVIDDLKIITSGDIDIVISAESEILSAIDRYSKVDRMVEDIVESVATDKKTAEVSVEEEREAAEKAPIAKLVDLIITEAVRSRANDVHVEPQEKDLRVRYRIDGVLKESVRSPKRIQAGIISRIKILAGMDIAERRMPQDGRFSLTVDGKDVDLRVATVPTIYGEKVVLRILQKEHAIVELEKLGFLENSLKRFETSFKKPYGAILVTGPTGCGKTTTLYASINILNEDVKNIITVEDPVEYRLAGINQVQVNVKAGLTFATGLRSILRNDPDIILIGEIRDEETALITVESALTGHLVLSTLHTNDAASSLTRLTEMGIEPFLTSSAVDCIVAQRLARRLCKHCKESYTPPRKALNEINFPLKEEKAPVLYRAKGCEKCDGVGYIGRIGVYEVLLVNEAIERLAVEEASSEEIKKAAAKEGMTTLWEDGLEKVRMGITSIEEVMRVII